MKTILKPMRQLMDVAALVVVLPLLGIVLARLPVGPFLQFPPRTVHVQHAAFSWWVFVPMALGIVAVVFPFIRHSATAPRGAESPSAGHPFPAWGWFGLGLGLVGWGLAWTRFSWFAPLQIFTFTPLWLAYILVVNALTKKRSGHCMLTDRPGTMALLFLFSAIFWWCFEYLNRFVQNWHYEGIGELSPGTYFVYATLPFATVLPAVLGTADLLATVPALSRGLDEGWKLRLPRPRLWAAFGFLAASAGMLLIGVYPDVLFPLLWVSPLILMVSLQALKGERTILSPLAEGKWRRVWLLALAALVCGFFWELWNWKSMGKWVYLVPFVNRFHIFEMPLLGYAGYLPFGLECAVVADALLGAKPADVPAGFSDPATRGIRMCRLGNLLIAVGLALFFFIVPGMLVVEGLRDPAIGKGEIPALAWRLHRNLTPRYGDYARQRVADGVAGHLHLYDVPSTEWPIFGSVYYLWATENLQAAWESDPEADGPEPAVYARDTIEACVELVLDPIHHSWVKQHWGEDYMHQENVFFRSLVIAAITARENLIGDGKHLDLLRDQVDTLAQALDGSPHGVLNDYPGECYPIDVLCSIACIQRADAVLGTDHSDFVRRSVRAFDGFMLDQRGLIPYLVDPISGDRLAPSRGVGNSYALIFAHELWPERAREWMQKYEAHFWQDRALASGFREFPPEYTAWEWGFDVDAGPIMWGFSPAANAFGLPAAVINGRRDIATTLWRQVLPSCWPLPNGHLLGPQLLSNWRHAPYLGEACMLYFFSARPAPGVEVVEGGRTAGATWILLLFLFGVGVLILGSAWRTWRVRRNAGVPHARQQTMVWGCLVGVAVVLILTGHPFVAAVCTFLALWLPRRSMAEL